jgi:hypothetical protein
LLFLVFLVPERRRHILRAVHPPVVAAQLCYL